MATRYTPVLGDITPDLITNPDMLCVAAFTPSELQSPDAGRHRADTLISSCATAGRLGHSKVILSYAYDEDRREIYQIGEIVNHIRYLLDKCPHLLYYIVSELDAVRPILLCLYGAILVSTRGARAQIGIPEIDRARELSKKLQADVMSYAASIGDKIGGADTVAVIKSLGI